MSPMQIVTRLFIKFHIWHESPMIVRLHLASPPPLPPTLRKKKQWNSQKIKPQWLNPYISSTSGRSAWQINRMPVCPASQEWVSTSRTNSNEALDGEFVCQTSIRQQEFLGRKLHPFYPTTNVARCPALPSIQEHSGYVMVMSKAFSSLKD